MVSGISFGNVCLFLLGISAQKLFLAKIACYDSQWPSNHCSKPMRPSLFAHVCTMSDAAKHLCLERDQSGLLLEDAGAWWKSGCDLTFDVDSFRFSDSEAQDLLDSAGKCQKPDRNCQNLPDTGATIWCLVPFNILSQLLQSWSLNANCVFLCFPMSFSAIHRPWFRFWKADLPLKQHEATSSCAELRLARRVGQQSWWPSPEPHPGTKTGLYWSWHQFTPEINHWIQVVEIATRSK